ncbi:uncharacterized protein BDZ99DRAFT_501778 [Mytilinidion resinicola]|uniref:Ricin B lectin domain-containing protein n=1 Tax=Mytilinidion resinicola TaxID=574789 RepID=A0A6A6YAJ5_9PEZI|nr:uncharacterized protein BDZ99DRAFT_501778 [Mytilinidion resinicola]KAF2805588.1 hypothetical protein BDZ99DRAFT_501778 [Mytilinidion resinicola]
MRTLFAVLVYITLATLAQGLRIDTLLAYTISNADSTNTVLYAPTTSGEADVVVTDISSAGNGANWYFTIYSGTINTPGLAYLITNQAFPGYRLDGHLSKVPYLASNATLCNGQIWHVDTWPDGSARIWQDCCGDGLTLAAMGETASVIEGNGSDHEWVLASVEASSTSLTLSSTTTPDSSSLIASTTASTISATTSEALSTTSTFQISASPTIQTSPTSTSPSSSGGLSTGAKAGIGVGIPMATIAGLALGYFLFRRRRGKGTSENVHTRKANTPAAQAQYYSNQQLPQPESVHEIYSQPEAYHGMHELPSRGYQ